MSWDAALQVGDAKPGRFDGVEWSWNYTHNTSAMIYEVIGDEGNPWWNQLSRLSGRDGATFLRRIIEGMVAKPDLMRSMNPTNGWGTYEGLLAVLMDMHDCSVECPNSRWVCSG